MLHTSPLASFCCACIYGITYNLARFQNIIEVERRTFFARTGRKIPVFRGSSGECRSRCAYLASPPPLLSFHTAGEQQTVISQLTVSFCVCVRARALGLFRLFFFPPFWGWGNNHPYKASPTYRRTRASSLSRETTAGRPPT